MYLFGHRKIQEEVYASTLLGIKKRGNIAPNSKDATSPLYNARDTIMRCLLVGASPISNYSVSHFPKKSTTFQKIFSKATDVLLYTHATLAYRRR